MHLELTNLYKTAGKIKKLYDIEDIVLFGSVMKGKDNAQDIDILIIFRDTVDKAAERLFKDSNSILDVNSITIKELHDENFIAREGIYLEGMSLLRKKTLASEMGFNSIAFIKYSLSSLSKSEQVRFYYAAQGRGGEEGFFAKVDAQRFSDNVIVVEYSSVDKVRAFFDRWKLVYTVFPTLVPLRLKHILLKK